MAIVTKTYKAGMHLFLERDLSRELYIIQSGSVRVYRKYGEKEIELATLGKGSVLGEMALIDGKPRSACARAITDCSVCIVDVDTFGKKIKGTPLWFISIIRLISQKIRKANDRLQNSLSHSSGINIVLALNYLFSKNRLNVPIKLQTITRGLSVFLCTSIEQIANMLQFLSEHSFVELKENSVILTDSQKLNDYCVFLRMYLRKTFSKITPLSDTTVKFILYIAERYPSIATSEEKYSVIEGKELFDHFFGLNLVEKRTDILNQLFELELLSCNKSKFVADCEEAIDGKVSINNFLWYKYTLYYKFKDCIPCK